MMSQIQLLLIFLLIVGIALGCSIAMLIIEESSRKAARNRRRKRRK